MVNFKICLVVEKPTGKVESDFRFWGGGALEKEGFGLDKTCHDKKDNNK